MPYLPFFFSVCTHVLLIINYFAHGRPCCHLVVYNCSCSILPTVPVHFYILGDAGTLFSNNLRCVPRHFNHSSLLIVQHNVQRRFTLKMQIFCISTWLIEWHWSYFARCPSQKSRRLFLILTRSSAIAERPCDASCQLKSCQLPRNSAVWKVLNKSKLWSWRVKVGRCVVNMCTQPWRVRVAFIVL